MAFFKFWGRRAAARGEGQVPAAKGAARGDTDSVEFLRRRARHRLMGAVVLVLIAIIGFPLLFETEPRPEAVNAQVTIPSQKGAAPLAAPQVAAAPANQSSGLDAGEQVVPPAETAAPAAVQPLPDSAPAESAGTAAPAGAASPGVPSVPSETSAAGASPSDQSAAAAQQAAAQQAAAEKLAAQKAADQKAAAEKAAADKAAAQRLAAQKEKEAAQKLAAQKAAAEKEAARKAAVAKAILAGTPPAKAAADKGRFVIQIGAYADSGSVRSARASATLLGVSTYVEQVKTQAGPRTRVRVGPFASRADADAAANKLKRGGMPAQIIPG